LITVRILQLHAEFHRRFHQHQQPFTSFTATIESGQFQVPFSPAILPSVARNFCLVVQSRPTSFNIANPTAEFNLIFIRITLGCRDIMPCRLVSISWRDFITVAMGSNFPSYAADCVGVLIYKHNTTARLVSLSTV
jgi:hypothetical protein